MIHALLPFVLLGLLGPEPVPVEAPAEAPAETPAETPSSAYVIVAGTPSESADKAPAPALQFHAGAMTMTRSEFIRTRSVDGESEALTLVPNRLRARLEARVGHLRMLAEVQDARVLGDPIGPARTGFHQLLGEYETSLAHARILLRFGRQEFDIGTRHLFGTAPWSALMRSWDGLRLSADFARGGFDFFAGSLARPSLSSGTRLAEQFASQVALTWVSQGYLHLFDALHIELTISGAHERSDAELRNIITNGLRLHGELLPGLRYDAEGSLQLGEIQRGRATQKHLAGSAFAKLEYLTPRGLGPGGKIKLGGVVGLDFASGSACTTTEFTGFEPCTEGTSSDFYSPWMARHGWLGHGDRFLASNVLDTTAGLRLESEPLDELELAFVLADHLFVFPEPGGRWQSLNTTVIGVDPDNQNRWAANEIDAEAGLTYRWLHLDLGWHLVKSLAGGRAISGVTTWQRIYLELTVDF